MYYVETYVGCSDTSLYLNYRREKQDICLRVYVYNIIDISKTITRMVKNNTICTMHQKDVYGALNMLITKSQSSTIVYWKAFTTL